MSQREEIIGRIREALRLVAQSPGHRDAPDKNRPIGASPRDWLPSVPSDSESQIEAFARCSADLKTRFIQVNSLAEASAQVNKIGRAEGWNLVASHRAPILEEALSNIGLPVLYIENTNADPERADVGITGCDALVAQTGSILLTARSAGGRALSVLPPHHLVIARESQVIADLPAAFELLREIYGDNFPSFMTLITGPSRTGDIERIVVLGAHGPKTLTVILVKNH